MESCIVKNDININEGKGNFIRKCEYEYKNE